MITQFVALFIYVVYPSRQDLRPLVFPRDNIFSHVLAGIYSFDTNTGVCPSLHVSYSLAMLSVWLKEKGVHPVWKTAIAIFLALVCLSTMFTKQHSAVDFFVALPICLAAELFVYRDRIFKKHPAKKQEV